MNRSTFSMADLIGSALLLTVLIFFSMAATANLDSRDARVRCAMNLRQIGQGLLLYSNDSKGPYPRTLYDANSADKPTAYTGVQQSNPFATGGPGPNDVSSGLYLLLRTEDITANVFVCPASGATADVYGGGIHTALDQSNFPSGKVLSYSYANPYPSPVASAAGYELHMGLDPSFAVAADMNPGSTALLQVTPASSAEQLRAANSHNHSSAGQNILYGDGHVEFNNSPFAGVNRDNIYTFGPSGEDPNTKAPLPTGGQGIWGSPVSANDSVLLPAAMLPNADVIVTQANSTATVPPPAAAPMPPVDQGTDMTVYIAISSLVFVLCLVILLAVLALKRRKSRPGNHG